MTKPANLLTVWAELLIDTLASNGATDVVISPGSRSTPFAIAAARNERLRAHVVIDERAAGFYALGLARVTGAPPLLVCTSGTAPAHYFPAVIEASESGLPLVVVSADRPVSLSACGAPQTIDQTRLFGSHARFFADLGEPDPSPSALHALRRTAARAIAESRGPLPGPVHLNARAAKPLEPREASTDEERALASLARSVPEVSIPPATLTHDAALLERIAERIERAERPAIVAGPLPLDAPRGAIVHLARSRGIALFAEASSQLRFTDRDGVTCGDAFDRWIESSIESSSTAPDLVLELGGTPTSGAYARWLERSRPARFVLGGSRFRDPSGRADAVLLGSLEPILDALTARLSPRAIDPAFASAIEHEERRAWSAVERALGASLALEEGTVTRALCAALPTGALLSLGNSLPIRHVDRFVPGGRALRVLSQRGANGIDGAVASIAAAAIADGGPAALLTGDVTLAHDVGSLALAARITSPLLIVVLDNDGGRIFDQLPVARAGLSEDELALFTTPPGLDLPSVADAFGVAYEHARDPASLHEALGRALSYDGATLLHARVPPEGAARMEAQIDALLSEAR